MADLSKTVANNVNMVEGGATPNSKQPNKAEFAGRYNKVCAFCKPMHVMSGPDFGADIPENLVEHTTKTGHIVRSVPHNYRGTPCTSGMCPQGEINAAEGAKQYYERREARRKAGTPLRFEREEGGNE